jgi:hypothetical protein
MTIEQAINKAKDGGYFWKPKVFCLVACDNSYFLDPTFWQSLFKDYPTPEPSTGKETWLYHWHRFIDDLSEGRTPKSFFESLQ